MLETASIGNWRAIAAELVERVDRPLALLDSRDRVCLSNRAFRQLFGTRRARARVSLAEVIGTPRVTAPVEQAVRAARRGVTSTCEVSVRRRDGRKVVLLLSFGEIAKGAVIATVLATLPPPSEDLPHLPEGLRYEVAVDPGAFGLLRSLTDEAGKSRRKGARCHQVLFGRDTPCPGCPAALLELAPASTRQTEVVPTATGPFRLVTAEKTEQNTVRLESYGVSESTVSALVQARIERLARSASLSRRERDVLQLLLLGRNLREMAAALEISVRTVRFHQGNLLEKLGADSRADLIRLIL